MTQSTSNDFDFAAEFAAFGDDLKGVAYDGEFQMEVTKAVAGTSAKGKRMFTVTLKFTDGPNAAKGKTVIDKLYWSPENDTAARIFAQSLRTLGAPQDWILANRPTPDQIAEQITGTVVNCRLKAEEFNNQPQTRVNYLSTVKAKGTGNAVAPSKAAKAVSLADEDETPAPAAEAPKEPVAAAAAPAGDGGDNPWAE